MTSTCYGPWSYKKIITDNRGHHSPIGWLIEDYLKNKELTEEEKFIKSLDKKYGFIRQQAY